MASLRNSAIGLPALIVLSLALTAPARADFVVANSVSDFSGTQGQNGWHYGYLVSPFTSATFTPMTQFLPSIFGPGNAWYADQNNYWTALTDVGAHPNGMVTSGGRLPVEEWADRRWVSTVDGPVTLTGNIAKINTNPGGNGVEGHIFVDGVEVYSQFVSATDSTGFNYTINATIHVGSAIDFALDPFASNDLADSSRFTAVVTTTAVPEPSSLTLLGMGMLSLVGYGWRRWRAV